jgi:hypothetical protein
VRRIASEILRPGRKANCDGPITSASAIRSYGRTLYYDRLAAAN